VAVVDAESGAPRVDRPTAPDGTPLPRIGAPATRALRAEGIWTLEQVRARSEEELAALHGVGPIALRFLREALTERGWAFADPCRVPEPEG
jgi:predicted flap endonuclease-1-like 5' DNA nuclease